MVIPRLVVAAPASGHGKTTVATGLLAAFAARGVRVAGFKVGPDYIDPGYHALAAGRPGRNLDPVLVGADLVGPLFAHGAAGADLAVIEGVMGLYDGRTGAGDHGSTAEVASLLRAPIALVVDAAAQGRSVAALVHGFRSFGAGVRLAGVILNRVGSPRHETILRDALDEIGVPVLGALHRHDAVAAPSRHLGLVPAVERRDEALAAVRALADVVAASVDLDAVLAAARAVPALPVQPWSPEHALRDDARVEHALRDDARVEHALRDETRVECRVERARVEPAPSGGTSSGGTSSAGPSSGGPSCGGPVLAAGRPVVAVAGGPAFSFGYAETVELLRGAGAEVVFIDPLRDEALPAGTRALVVGGGFPEVYAADLAANATLRAEVAALARGGAPIAAECAGLLWLCHSLDGAPMCGVLDADATMTDRLTLGYRDAVALTDSWLAPTGSRVTGHEFHRTAITRRAALDPQIDVGRSTPVPSREIRVDRPTSNEGPPYVAKPAGSCGHEPPVGVPALTDRDVTGAAPAWGWRATDSASATTRRASGEGATAPTTDGFVLGGVHASYLHLHWAAYPAIARRLVAACG